MFRRPHYVALTLVVVVVLIVLNLPQETTVRIKLAVGSIFLPLFGLAGASQQAAAKVGDAVVPREDLTRELEQLRAENSELKLRLRQADDIRRENDQIRGFLGFPKLLPWKVKAGRVIAREPANWWRTLQINLGSRDGLRVDLPVISTEGLVGRVSAVGLTRSQIVLLGDVNCRVAAMVQETRDHGIVVPSSSGILDHTLVDITYLPRSTSQLKPGQTIVTSGMGGVFPKGLVVGTIADARTVGYDLYLEARVKLAVDSSRLEDVWVILP
jgi:rod shape-determining protein MreC